MPGPDYSSNNVIDQNGIHKLVLIGLYIILCTIESEPNFKNWHSSSVT